MSFRSDVIGRLSSILDRSVGDGDALERIDYRLDRLTDLINEKAWCRRMTTFKTEAEFQAEVERMCTDRGLWFHHCTDARKCHGRGWVDLVIISPCGNGIIFAELKQWQELSPDQVAVKWCLKANGAEHRVWKPNMMDEITAELDHLADCAVQHESA